MSRPEDEEYYSQSPYYCMPRIHVDPGSQLVLSAGFWLVTTPLARGLGNGVYRSWSSAEAATTGIVGSPPKFSTLQECMGPCRGRCDAGEHAHPTNPTMQAARAAPPYTSSPPPQSPAPPPHTPSHSCASNPGTGAVKSPQSSALCPVSIPALVWEIDNRLPPSSPPTPAPELDGVPSGPFFYAVCGGGLTHGTIGPAMTQYHEALKANPLASLITTLDSLIAMFFSQGHDQEHAQILAVLERADEAEAASGSDELWESLEPIGEETWETACTKAEGRN
ncbi:hypothetical protein C8J57DRAFT_1529153 [Mycena rebaudengoi]|nr:hypothetical protein C8J57DRAFT_1529153 [Mycena rebaudengoi]